MFAIHQSSSLPQLTKFGLAVDERKRNNPYVCEVLGLYILFLFHKVLVLLIINNAN